VERIEEHGGRGDAASDLAGDGSDER
jgi:hypothetical protein